MVRLPTALKLSINYIIMPSFNVGMFGAVVEHTPPELKVVSSVQTGYQVIVFQSPQVGS